MNIADELMSQINQYSFMIDDITLYMDTHPDCMEATAAYEKYKALRAQAIEQYTSSYGPICRYNVSPGKYSEYINQPWPWEGGCNR